MYWHTENNSHRINHILSIIILLFPHSHYLHIMKMQKYLTILNTRWQIDRLYFIHCSRYLVSSIHTISHPLHITSGHWTLTLPGGTGVMNDGIPGVPCSCPRNSEHLHRILYYYVHRTKYSSCSQTKNCSQAQWDFTEDLSPLQVSAGQLFSLKKHSTGLSY